MYFMSLCLPRLKIELGKLFIESTPSDGDYSQIKLIPYVQEQYMSLPDHVMKIEILGDVS